MCQGSHQNVQAEESPLIDLLVSHVMPMSQIQEAFELLAAGECAKVVLKPWE